MMKTQCLQHYYNNTNLDEFNPELNFFRITCDVSRRRLTTLSVVTTSFTSSQTLKTFGRRTPCGRCQRGSSHVVKKWANDTGLKSCCSQQLDIEFHKKGHCKQSNKFFHSVYVRKTKTIKMNFNVLTASNLNNIRISWYVFWLTMTSHIESIRSTQYNPLYENEKFECKSSQWRLLAHQQWKKSKIRTFVNDSKA